MEQPVLGKECLEWLWSPGVMLAERGSSLVQVHLQHLVKMEKGISREHLVQAQQAREMGLPVQVTGEPPRRLLELELEQVLVSVKQALELG
jgi:hypothetical protein